MEEKMRKLVAQDQDATIIKNTPTPIEKDLIPSIGTDIVTPYSNVLQSKPIHGLLASSTAHGNIQLNAITHEGSMRSEGVLITIGEGAIPNISAQTFKVLIILLTDVTEQLPRKNEISAEKINKGRKVQIPLKEYMRICKIKDVKEARAQLNDSIRALSSIKLEWDEDIYIKPEGKSHTVKQKRHYSMPILGLTSTDVTGKPIKNGTAYANFDYDMAEYLCGVYMMPYPADLLTINTAYHKSSIPLGWKLCALHNMNIGKKRANITTVKTLLSSAKEIPRYEDIAATGGIYRNIILRFDKDLAALVEAGVLSSYWYFSDDEERIESGYYKDGKYIESGRLALMSYAEFSALYIHYELKDYPDQTPRLEEKSKRIKAAISRRKNAAKKKSETTGDGAQ